MNEKLDRSINGGGKRTGDQRILFIGIEASGIAVGEGEGALAVGVGEAAAAGEDGTVVAEKCGVVLSRAFRSVVWQAGGMASRLHPLPDHRREPMVELEPDAAGRRLGSDCKKQHDDGNGDEKIAVSHGGEERSVCRGWPAGTTRSLVSMARAEHRY